MWEKEKDLSNLKVETFVIIASQLANLCSDVAIGSYIMRMNTVTPVCYNGFLAIIATENTFHYLLYWQLRI